MNPANAVQVRRRYHGNKPTQDRCQGHEGIREGEAAIVDTGRRRLARLAAVLALVVAPCAGADVGANPVLNFGVVPQQAATRLAEEWGPLLAEVGRRAGVSLIFRTAPTVPAFEGTARQGRIRPGLYEPLPLRRVPCRPGIRGDRQGTGPQDQGVLVVRTDSPYRKVAELAGKTVIFPAPAAFAASILPQAEFDARTYASTPSSWPRHDSVPPGRRQWPAGSRWRHPAHIRGRRAGNPRKLRILTETPPYTPHAFAIHPRVPPQIARRVVSAMASLAEDETGRRLLAPLAFKGIEPARDQDWNDIRGLDIELLSQSASTDGLQPRHALSYQDHPRHCRRHRHGGWRC